MKLKIRPDDASMLQMNDWLAELRADERPEPAAARRPAGPRAQAASGVWAGTLPPVATPAFPSEPAFPAELAPGVPAELAPAAPAEPAPDVPAEPPVASARALIGDQLRRPVMWCELAGCISRHADPAALGEGDARAQAIDAGWRIDAFGRLACPRCQQAGPDFRAACQPVRWNRHTAMARAAGALTGWRGC